MASDGTFSAKSSPALPYFGVRDTMTNAAAAPAATDLAAEKAEGRAAEDDDTALAARVSAGRHMISKSPLGSA